MAVPDYPHSVFLNVPLDDKYRPIFEALVFAVHDCGFVARSAFESDDATQVRLSKLLEIIGSSKYGIHDISCTTVDRKYKLPRFNMPFELGLFMGAKHFGQPQQRLKLGLVLDRDRYRYQIFCSDIAGQDIRAHNDRPANAIRSVRSWLRASSDTSGKKLPGADYMVRRYQAFRRGLPRLCDRFNLDSKNLHFVDYTTLVVGWIEAHP